MRERRRTLSCDREEEKTSNRWDGMGTSYFSCVAATLVLDESGTNWGEAVGVDSGRCVASFGTSSDARTPVGIEEDQQRASLQTTKGRTCDLEGKGLGHGEGFKPVR